MKYNELKKGQTVYLDGGFTCAPSGPVKVEQNATGFFFKCDSGKHYFDGQLDDDAETLVGVSDTPYSSE